MFETPSCLLLACPNTDLTLSQPNAKNKGTGWGMGVADMEWFIEQWAPDAEQRNRATVSPLYADLWGLPPTLLATAEHDLLRSEGIMLGTRMRECDVNVDHVEYAGLVHGFLGLGHVSQVEAEAGEELFQRFHRQRRNLS